MSPEKVILVDCDGVLLDWEYAFDAWMSRHGYCAVVKDQYKMNVKYGLDSVKSKSLVRMFNESATIGRLPPFRDAIKYVRKLHEEHGYVFHAITSLSNDEFAQDLRTKNLCRLFGETTFERYVYLDCGADKDEALAEYEGSECWWVEDKPENAKEGIRQGLRSILIAHAHNEHCTNPPIIRLGSWKEIYELITGK